MQSFEWSIRWLAWGEQRGYVEREFVLIATLSFGNYDEEVWDKTIRIWKHDTEKKKCGVYGICRSWISVLSCFKIV